MMANNSLIQNFVIPAEAGIQLIKNFPRMRGNNQALSASRVFN